MRRSGYVRIDVADIIEEIDDDDLIQEVKDRNLTFGADGTIDASSLELVREAHAELKRGRPASALSILDRLLLPKWKSCDAAAKAYDDMFSQRDAAIHNHRARQ